MLRWLLKYEGYPPGVVFALLLHGGLILFLIGRQFQPQELMPVEKPVFITATLIQENPQQQRAERRRTEERQQQQAREREQQRQAEAARQAEAEKQRQAAAARQREADAQKQREAEAEKQRQAEAEKQRQAEAEKQRQAEAEKQRQAEAEKQRQAEAEKQRQAEAEAERRRQAEAERQRQAEAERQAAAAAAAEAEAAATNLVNQYSATIMGLFYDCWNTPALARTGMMAQIEIRMVPTGEIVASTITRSSGDSAFDRSVEQAALCVDRVPEMMDLPSSVFDRNFRVFTVTLDFDDVSR